ncbi:MAG: glycosyltransferase family 1 protein [Bacteroidales bacterium]
MKIGIEAQHLFREQKYGREMATLETLRGIQTIDNQNEYVIFVKPDMDNACLQQSLNIKIVELKSFFHPLWEQFSLMKAAKSEGCDILHCTSGTAPVYTDIPLLLTLRATDIVKSANDEQVEKAAAYKKWNLPKAVGKAHTILTFSEYEKQKIMQHYPKAEGKIQLLTHGLREDFKTISNKKELQKVRDKYKLPERFLLLPGNKALQENTENVLKAYAIFCSKNKPVPLVMVDFSKTRLKKILARIGEEQLMEHITTTGYIINTDLPYIYNLSELFLFPVKSASFGYQILEAMACGTPVLTSASAHLEEISDNAAYTANPESEEEISLGIFRILNNKSLKNKNINKGVKITKDLSWITTARQTLQLYASVKH